MLPPLHARMPSRMADKTTHFGRAGECFAMSELLLRGWNVAVPVVDVGDDVFVIDDNDKTTWRLQVKSAEGESIPEADGGGVTARFALSRVQLRTPQPIELFFMLIIRHEGTWREKGRPWARGRLEGFTGHRLGRSANAVPG